MRVAFAGGKDAAAGPDAHFVVQTAKKTLISAQNLENKGSEFFLPPRSMVLKVVTGKILKR